MRPRRSREAVMLSGSLPSSLILAVAVALGGNRATSAPGPAPIPILHLYRELSDGGAQEVLANNVVDRRGVAALRVSLRRAASAYARGAYPNPDGRTAAVAKLRAHAGRISVRYVDLPRGGEIRFSTVDAGLVAALHDWMAATVRVNRKVHHDGGPGTGGG